MTFHWLYRLAAVVGFAVMGTGAFVGLAALTDWVTRPRQGFWRTRRPRIGRTR